jgi:hypothetical protein
MGRVGRSNLLQFIAGSGIITQPNPALGGAKGSCKNNFRASGVIRTFS